MRTTNPISSRRSASGSALKARIAPGSALWRVVWAFSIGLSLSAAPLAAEATAASPQRPISSPNFLVIVADDLGFSDMGAFGGEIETPNLDKLAKRGLRFTDFHGAATCSPTRAMLLTGTDNHRAGLGNMAELIAQNQRGKPGYQGYLSANVVTLAERLGAVGYRTLFSGKWHLGVSSEQDPHQRGFQQSFALLNGWHNHFGMTVRSDADVGFKYTEDGQSVESLREFYSSDEFTNKLIEQLRETAPSGKPFFAYLAFTAPHWPLQVPAEDIALYRGRYDAGFEALRGQRLKRMARLGLIDRRKAAHEMNLPAGGWRNLSKAERVEQTRAMEIYAAMIHRLDRNIGHLLDYLSKTRQSDNTVIIFLSDNGADGVTQSDAWTRGLERRLGPVDNRVANMGSATSAIAYGRGWAQATTAPFRLFKVYATEGGTRVPAFITFAGLGRRGEITDEFASVQDIVPTLLDLAGLPRAGPKFQGRSVESVRGKSWVPFLSRSASHIYRSDEAVGWEVHGHRAIRRGEWKLVAMPGRPWELFNLSQDPAEARDLAQLKPDIFQQMIAEWDAYARDMGVVLPSTAPYLP